MKFLAILAAAGHALIAAAEHLEASPAGQTVAADAKKTLSDGVSAAIAGVRQGATNDAVAAASSALTKVGVPAEAATLLSQLGVSQGETFLAPLLNSLAPAG